MNPAQERDAEQRDALAEKAELMIAGGFLNTPYNFGDTAREVAKAYLAERERSRWQPIATAPKDGTRVLVVSPRYGKQAVVLGWYENASFGGWFMDGSRMSGEPQPTHWMPLPPAPGDAK